MNTFSNTFSAEVARVARKELKPELQDIRKTLGIHRSEMAALQRELRALASHITAPQRAPKVKPKAADSAPAADQYQASGKPGKERQPRFQSQAMANKREALGLTQKEMARLIGASSLSVYRWESGHKQPRGAEQLARIAQVLKMGKREALEALANPDSQASEMAQGAPAGDADAPQDAPITKAKAKAAPKGPKAAKAPKALKAAKAAKNAAPADAAQADAQAQTLMSKREALDLTRQDMAKLLDASLKSVYRWESGQMQPRSAAQLARIAQVLKMDKRQALEALGQM